MTSFLNQILFIFITTILFWGCEKATYQGKLIPQLNKELNLYGFIDTLGNYIIPPKFSKVAPFQGDTTFAITRIEYRNLVGLINRKGEWVYPPIIEDFDFDYTNHNILSITLHKKNRLVNALLKPNFVIQELLTLRCYSKKSLHQ